MYGCWGSPSSAGRACPSEVHPCSGGLGTWEGTPRIPTALAQRLWGNSPCLGFFLTFKFKTVCLNLLAN